MSGLSDEVRESLAKAGDHHPDLCDCDPYAPDNGYPDDMVCDALADTFAAVRTLIHQAEARSAAAVVERVEAVIDALRASAADSLIGSPNRKPVVSAIAVADDLRAALTQDGGR